MGYGILSFETALAVMVYLLKADSGLPRPAGYQSPEWPAYQYWKGTCIWLWWTVPNFTFLTEEGAI